jgi:hypothetical protein
MEAKIYTEDILNRKYKNTNTERKRRNGNKVYRTEEKAEEMYDRKRKINMQR